ncbi:MAG: ferredoxin [Longimicrobiales bacterium]
MEDYIERNVGGLTIRIDRLLCVGFGDCIEVAGEAFAFDADGIVAFRDGIDTITREHLIQACTSCPVDALTLLGEHGQQLAP